MIMLVRPVDPEGDNNLIKKRDGRKLCPTGAKIGPGVKHKLIAPIGEIRSFEKRPINPAIIIRCHRGDQPAWFTVTTIEIDSQPGGGTARGGVVKC